MLDRGSQQTQRWFLFNYTATTEIYALSLHDALPICRHLPAARHAPGGPQVEQHCAPAPLGEATLAPLRVPEGEVGHAQRSFGDRERGHFPARQWRQTLRQLDCGRTGGVGRIAL